MSKHEVKIKRTRKERAEINKRYLEWLDLRYPIKVFEIGGWRFSYRPDPYAPEDDGERTFLLYSEEEETKKEKQREFLLRGEDIPEELKLPVMSRSRFIINQEKKTFNYSLDERDRNKGLGEKIYYQAPKIMKAIGIVNADEYTIKIAGNKDHPYFKRLETKRIVAKTYEVPDTNKARDLLEKLKQYKTPMKLGEYRLIISYAINSNVPMDEIADAINANGFNVVHRIAQMVPTFDKEEAEEFRKLNITGIKPSCLSKYTDGRKGFGVLSLFESADSKDATEELRNLIEYYKRNPSQLPKNILQLNGSREIAFIILYLDKSGFLFRDVDSKLKKTIKRGALSLFNRMDPEHTEEWNYNADRKSRIILKVLKDANMLDESTYIELYQRALNRNYTLDVFKEVISPFVSDDTAAKALQEISRNIYCPCPRTISGQKSKSSKDICRPQRVLIPNNIIIGDKGFKERMVQAIRDVSTPAEREIKTTMLFRKNKTLMPVSNMISWMFGVEGWKGYLNINKVERYAEFPPQTPKEVINILSKAIRVMEDPDYGTRV